MAKPILIVAVCALLAAGCSAVPEDKKAPEPSEHEQASPDASETAPAVLATQTTSLPPHIPPPRPTESPQDTSSPVLTSTADKGEPGARAVLQTWAQALENHDYDLAWGQFRHPPSGRNSFAKWWSRYDTIEARFGKGEGDGGAGSLYYTVPVTLTGLTVDGQPYRLQGPVVLRRVNDVDGATPGQLRWHIDSANLKDVTPD